MRYIEFVMDCPGEEMDARCEKMAELGAGGFVIENEDDFKNFDEYVEEEKFKQKLMSYFDKIEINEDVIAKYPINEVIYSESWTYIF